MASNTTVSITLSTGETVARIGCVVDITVSGTVLIEEVNDVFLDSELSAIISPETLARIAAEVIQHRAKSTGVCNGHNITVTMEEVVNILTETGDRDAFTVSVGVFAPEGSTRFSRTSYTYSNPDKLIERVKKVFKETGIKERHLKAIMKVKGKSIAKHLLTLYPEESPSSIGWKGGVGHSGCACFDSKLSLS